MMDSVLKMMASVLKTGEDRPAGTGKDDGTFYIDWTHFLMGFTVVECCLAYRGWHCSSLPNAFPNTKSVWRVCEKLYRFTAPAGEHTSLYLMILQPTKRGAWCRNDRKKSYRPGDLSLIVVAICIKSMNCALALMDFVLKMTI